MTFKILSSTDILWLCCVYMPMPVCVYVSSACVSMSVCLDVSVFLCPCVHLYVSPVCTQSDKVEGFPEWALPGRRLIAYKAAL